MFRLGKFTEFILQCTFHGEKQGNVTSATGIEDHAMDHNSATMKKQ